MELEKFGKVLENVNLKKFNTYMIEANVKYMVYPFDVTSLKELIKYLKENDIKYFILGNGSNIILKDYYYDGVFIKLESLNELLIEGNTVYAEAGVMGSKLVLESIDKGLKGLEWAYGIAGTVGGLVYGNAGAYNATIFDHLVEVTVLDGDEVKVLKKRSIKHQYRETNLEERIVLAVKFKLFKGDTTVLLKTIDERKMERIAKQPLNRHNAGSVFRNPEGLYAGKLIDDLGLKGKVVGGAMISEKHANFIVNVNNAATGEDVIALIELIKTEVKAKYDIDLVLEQKIITFN